MNEARDAPLRRPASSSQMSSPPPDASSIAPEMKEASSDSSHRIALAISSASPTRPHGIDDSMPARKARVLQRPSVISVSTMPGRSELTRMPSAATSLAKPLVKESTAALLAA